MSIKRNLFILLGVVVLLFIVLVAGITASGSINVQNPETAKGPVIVPPLLAPPHQSGYVTQQLGSVISAPDGRPIAQLTVPPVDLSQEVAINLPTSRPDQNSEKVSYAILASVRYRGNGHTVLVTTARPSLAAAQQPSVLGNETVRLNDGSIAWVTRTIPGASPNQLVLVRGDLIITIASELPVDFLQTLAAQVVVK